MRHLHFLELFLELLFADAMRQCQLNHGMMHESSLDQRPRIASARIRGRLLALCGGAELFQLLVLDEIVEVVVNRCNAVTTKNLRIRQKAVAPDHRLEAHACVMKWHEDDFVRVLWIAPRLSNE